jgi:hypothetical protein
MKIIFRGTAEVIYPNTLDGYAEYRQFCGTRLQLFVTRPKNVAYLFFKNENIQRNNAFGVNKNPKDGFCTINNIPYCALKCFPGLDDIKTQCPLKYNSRKLQRQAAAG